jgi:arylsulfatase A-like enzyme
LKPLLFKQILILMAVFFFGVTVLVGINLCVSLALKKNVRRHAVVLIFLAWLAVLYGNYYFVERPGILAAATTDKPNVIIIGLDGLRPDYTSFNHSPYVHTPNIDHYLQSASVLTESYTPLARTFPAWVSILTGTYPKHNRARENLSDVDTIKLDETLAKHMQVNGYETVYASDDSAWSPIDKRFGFDHVVVPPNGVAALLLGMINDFPLSNLLITTPLGKLMFPSNYANHLMAFSYDPENFLHLLKAQLHQRSGQPFFLAVHFNLSGWPHFWFREKNTFQTTDFDAYKNTMSAVDKQLGEFFDVLAQNKLLDHTLVVLLSDHGTGLGLPGDRITAESFYEGNKNNIKLMRSEYSVPVKDKEGHVQTWGIDSSNGYGHDVLSTVAYHTLLAFKGYGFDIGPSKSIATLSSLIDIAPTVLDLLNMPPLSVADGISLKPYFLASTKESNNERAIFMETALSLSVLTEQHVSIPKVISTAANLFQVDPANGAISMKQAVADRVNKSAEKAVLQGNWLLANLPASVRYKKVGKQFIAYIASPQFILVDVSTGRWTAEMNTPLATSAPIKQLQEKLAGFYGRELS